MKNCNGRMNMKKKIISVVIIVAIVLVVGSIFGPTVINKIGKDIFNYGLQAISIE